MARHLDLHLALTDMQIIKDILPPKVTPSNQAVEAHFIEEKKPDFYIKYFNRTLSSVNCIPLLHARCLRVPQGGFEPHPPPSLKRMVKVATPSAIPSG